MIAFRITGFSGVVPRRGARLLEPNQAQVAVNCRLTSGYIGPLKPPFFVVDPGVVGLKTIFRMTDGQSDFWLAWNRDVDAAKGPIAGDTTFRTYYSGDGEPRVTNISLATAGAPFPNSGHVLGVFPPATAASLTHAGGAGAAVDRAFVYTFVTPFGEESQPSPPTAIVTGKVDGTWTIGATTGMNVAPLNSFGVTGASWSGGVATVLIPATFGLRVGEEVAVSNITPAGYNGTRIKITAINPGVSISYLVTSNPGAYVSGGTVARNGTHNTAGMMKRIYWTETLADGTHLRLVKEVTVATTNTTVAGNTISTAELASADWVQPPTDMQGIQFMPNGIAIGFHGNELLFSPSYIPYAYPVAYRLTMDYDIIGIGVVGAMAVVVTKGNPYAVSGIDPSTMSPIKVDQPWPGQSKGSIVNMGFGVAYAAPQGLALIGPGGSDLVTRELYTQEEWVKLIPATIRAAQYAGRYVASFDFAANSRQVLIIDKSEFATETMANANVTTFYGDPTTGRLYAVVDDQILDWDADPGLRMTADWFSREQVFPKPVNLGAAKVDADFTMSSDDIAAAQAANEAQQAINAALIAALATQGSLNGYSVNGLSLNGSLVKALPAVTWDSLTFQLYIDGALKFSKTLTNSKAFKMPAGYKADNAACRVSGNITVKGIVVAETTKGLEQA